MSEFIDLNDNIEDSSKYAFLQNSILHSKSNKFCLDNMSTYYLIDGNIKVGIYDFLKKYENILENYLTRIKIDKDYFYKPEYASFSYYGTPDLWYLFLFFNKMKDPSEFIKEDIVIIDRDSIAILNEIYEKELGKINNSDEPIEISDKTYKDLSIKSDFISKEKTNVYKPMKVSKVAKYKPAVLYDFENDFVDKNLFIIDGKIEKDLLPFKTSSYYDANLENGFNFDGENCFKSFNQSNTICCFKGKFFSEKTGLYNFLAISNLDCDITINDTKLKTLKKIDFSKETNIYASQNSNYNFNAGDSSFWTYVNNNSFIKQNNTENYLSFCQNNIKDKEVTVLKATLDGKYVDHTKEFFIINSKFSSYVTLKNGQVFTIKTKVFYTDGETSEKSFDIKNLCVEENYLAAIDLENKTVKKIETTFIVRKKDETELGDVVLDIYGLCVYQPSLEDINIYCEKNKWNNFSIDFSPIQKNKLEYVKLCIKMPDEKVHKLVDKKNICTEKNDFLTMGKDYITPMWNIEKNKIQLIQSDLGINIHRSDCFYCVNGIFKTKVSTTDFDNNGCFGLTFRQKDKDDYYLYVIKKEIEKSTLKRSIISGLYKINKNFDKIPICDDSKYCLNAKLLSLTKQNYFYNQDNLILINFNNNVIRIYDSFDMVKPIINYKDFKDPYLEGGIGFFTFNLSNATFSNTRLEFFY